MNPEKALEVDCKELSDYLSFEEIVAINLYVTDPEQFREKFSDHESFKNHYEGLVEPIKNSSPAYSDGGDRDYFEIHEAGTLQNLLETEFLYKCRENNDAAYLSALLMHRIASGHPFGEGNKRTSYLSACIFLIKHQLNYLGLDAFSIPSLDKDLLESLGDIAEDHSTISPEKLAKQYRKSLKKDLKEITAES